MQQRVHGTPDQPHAAYASTDYNVTPLLRILNVNAGTIDSVFADGSGNHVLTSAVYDAGFDWSPDGQWIVATNTTTGRLDLIQATTRQTIPLRNKLIHK